MSLRCFAGPSPLSLSFWTPGDWLYAGNPHQYKLTQHDLRVTGLLAGLPADVPASASGRLQPHVNRRPVAFAFPPRDCCELVDWLVVDLFESYPAHYRPRSEAFRVLAEELVSGRFGVVDATDGVVMARRGAAWRPYLSVETSPGSGSPRELAPGVVLSGWGRLETTPGSSAGYLRLTRTAPLPERVVIYEEVGPVPRRRVLRLGASVVVPMADWPEGETRLDLLPLSLYEPAERRLPRRLVVALLPEGQPLYQDRLHPPQPWLEARELGSLWLPALEGDADNRPRHQTPGRPARDWVRPAP